MELYLFIVIILFILAISDLIVGVSNDAVNFLNSAIGARVAPRHIIMIVASLGIVAGTLFSSGLMEVARKGIFNPENFYFPELMILFLAVMITDVTLLDFYNTFSMPTSSTVSIVFALLGAAVSISLIKIYDTGQDIGALINYINTSKALAIISGILLSVVVAFTVGAIIQFVTRLIFTFDYEKKFRRYGAIWGGLSLAATMYFIIKKGAKGAAFLTADTNAWLNDNMSTLILIIFVVCTVIFQILILIKRVNILKVLVLIGTFALALAFAANDLVNFIGVPLAGLASYIIGAASNDPGNLMMHELSKPVESNTILLLIAGVIMVVTLWKSKKAQTVIRTSLNLGRQNEGYERFGSSTLARMMVRVGVSTHEVYAKYIPEKMQQAVGRRFDEIKQTITVDNYKDIPAFDLIRASVNLTVAASLISFATSLKLPLSTTYVTFMVAMGTSLADKAWGRESAVYRVNGVITVIGGWFLTAFLAFTVAGLIAWFIYAFELLAILLLIGLAGYFIYRTQILHKTKTEEEDEAELAAVKELAGREESAESLAEGIQTFSLGLLEPLQTAFAGFASADRKVLKKANKLAKKLDKATQRIVTEILTGLEGSEELMSENYSYGKIIGSLHEVSSKIKNIANLCFDHVENNHKPPSAEQIEDLNQLVEEFKPQVEILAKQFGTTKPEDFETLTAKHDDFVAFLRKLDKNQISRIKKKADPSRSSLLFINVISDLDNVSANLVRLVSAWRNTFSK